MSAIAGCADGGESSIDRCVEDRRRGRRGHHSGPLLSGRAQEPLASTSDYRGHEQFVADRPAFRIERNWLFSRRTHEVEFSITPLIQRTIDCSERRLKCAISKRVARAVICSTANGERVSPMDL